MKDVTLGVNQLISKVEELTTSLIHPISGGYCGKCPAHDDTNKSLRILENNDGGYLIRCVEGCTTHSIMAKLGYSSPKERTFSTPISSPIQNHVIDSVQVVGINEFISMDLPKKEMILSPFLTTQGIVLIYAKRGVGKTHLSLGIAYAIASGSSFLKWHAERSKRVLFIDGEMTGADIQDRLKRISLASNTTASDENFQIITPDLQADSLPNLSRKEGREVIDGYLETFDVLILDNLSSLFRSSFENEADSWQEIQDWLLDLRRKGKSIVIVHHAGKSGQQRGTSKREDVADTVICLKNPEGYSPEEGACFEVHFQKTRHFSGVDAAAFAAKLIVEDDGLWYWEVTSTEDNREVEIVAEGVKSGLTIQQIVEQTGLSKSQVETRKLKAKSMGLIK